MRSRPDCGKCPKAGRDEAYIRARPALESTSNNGPWVLEGTVVNVALPALPSSLHASATDVQWVVEAYTLFLAALLLVGGSLGDLYGRRKIFALGVAGFAIASLWCGLAPDISQLILARALQGAGAALLFRAASR